MTRDAYENVKLPVQLKYEVDKGTIIVLATTRTEGNRHFTATVLVTPSTRDWEVGYTGIYWGYGGAEVLE